MKRLDSSLVEWGLAPSRNKAQSLIGEGEVEILQNGEWRTVTDNSFNTAQLKSSDVRISKNAKNLRYVSRGGLKLEAAAQHLKLNPRGWRCLDVGISTGGFTDYLLQAGAAAVFGLDVGHGQLHAKLAGDPRVTEIEGLNAKDMAADARVRSWILEGVNLAVADLSFISLTQVLPALAELLPAGTALLALVKPQFEVGPSKAGVELFNDVQSRVLHGADKCGFSSQEYFSSAVKGQDGNQEFFLWCRRR